MHELILYCWPLLSFVLSVLTHTFIPSPSSCPFSIIYFVVFLFIFHISVGFLFCFLFVFLVVKVVWDGQWVDLGQVRSMAPPSEKPPPPPPEEEGDGGDGNRKKQPTAPATSAEMQVYVRPSVHPPQSPPNPSLSFTTQF